MKSLFTTPSWRAGRVRLADYAELMALKSSRRRASSGDLIASFDRKEDEDEDRFEHPVEEAFEELADRIAHLGAFSDRYPFQLEQDEILVRSKSLQRDDGWLYVFLLLATGLNMRDERKHASLDGADLFEELSGEVGLRYFGHAKDSRTKKRVFGTSRCNWPDDSDTELKDDSKFKKAVDSLCKDMGEGGRFRPKSNERLTARDDKLDVVIWRDFSDRRTSKLIGFGQCKTGTHWLNELPRLNPESFCRRWLDTPLASPAIKMFFLTDRIAGELTHKAYEAGILFDRCRVLDYANDLPKELLKKCAKWSRAALAAQGVRLK